MATAKKKPSAAQIAARKLFAERAKAGTLKKGGSVKRKTNPIKKSGDFVIYTGNIGKVFAVDLTLTNAIKIAKYQKTLKATNTFTSGVISKLDLKMKVGN